MSIAMFSLLVPALFWAVPFFLMPPLTPQERIVAAQLSLERALTDRVVSVDPALIRMPLPEVENAEHRKSLFIAALLPLIVAENSRIESLRTQAATVDQKGPVFRDLAKSYGLPANASRQQLLRRIDIIPASLALAQAALESGWGTSRFAREGRAFFGERTFDLNDPGLLPRDADEAAQPFLVKSFETARRSVASYMKTLNTNPAYASLRQRRALVRKAGKRPSGLDLVGSLLRYSEIGSTYIKRLTNTIKANRLQRFEGLRPTPTA